LQRFSILTGPIRVLLVLSVQIVHISRGF